MHGMYSFRDLNYGEFRKLRQLPQRKRVFKVELMLSLFFQQAFSQYLAYRRDNNELLLFVLKQLAKEQITYFRSRYRSEPDVIDIQEDEFIDRVRMLYF